MSEKRPSLQKRSSQGTTAVPSKNESKKQNYFRQFERLQLVGEGTFGKVYKIRSLVDGKIYALKNVLQDPKYKNRELSIISQLKHYNIVHMHDSYFTKEAKGEYLNLIMNYMPTTLFSVIRQNRKSGRRFTDKQIKTLAFQLFKAFAYLEDISLAHRDLKPLNILINPETLELNVCDFGSAKFLSPNQQNVAYMCSRYYRPPELLFGITNYQVEIDVWSIGCILVEFLTNQPLFTGESTVDQVIEIMKILGCPPKEYFHQCKEEFRNLQLPNLTGLQWKKVLKKYKPDPLFIELISESLTYDRQNRIKPSQALLHPYFNDLGSEEMRKFVQGIPHFYNMAQNEFVDNAGVKSALQTKYKEMLQPIQQQSEQIDQ